MRSFFLNLRRRFEAAAWGFRHPSLANRTRIFEGERDSFLTLTDAAPLPSGVRRRGIRL